VSGSSGQRTPLIKDVLSWQEVMELLAGECSVQLLTVAVDTVVRLHRADKQRQASKKQLDANRAAFSKLVQLAFKQLGSFGDVACAQYIYSSAALRAPLSPAKQAAWEARALEVLDCASPQAVANIIWAFTTLGQQPGNSLMTALRLALPRALCEGIPHHVANSLWGWSKLGQTLDGDLAAAAAAAVAAKAGGMKLRELANTIYAFARGGWPLSGKAQAALRQELPRALQQGNEQAVANILWAWSKLGLQLDATLAAEAEKAVLRTLPHMRPIAARQITQAFSSGVPGFKLSSAMAAAVKARRQELRA
jgi:hypothetical protein